MFGPVVVANSNPATKKIADIGGGIRRVAEGPKGPRKGSVDITVPLGIGFTAGFEVGSGGKTAYVGPATGIACCVSVNTSSTKVTSPGFHTSINGSACYSVVCSSVGTDVTGPKPQASGAASGGVGFRYGGWQSD